MSKPRRRNSTMPLREDSSNLKVGKWTKEEEKHAYQLIFEFENGTLSDCENGSTLRSYLAKKLNCSPMRVSKKFAGKCIGKHVFIRKQDCSLEKNEKYIKQATEAYKALSNQQYRNNYYNSTGLESSFLLDGYPQNTPFQYDEMSFFTPKKRKREHEACPLDSLQGSAFPSPESDFDGYCAKNPVYFSPIFDDAFTGGLSGKSSNSGGLSLTNPLPLETSISMSSQEVSSLPSSPETEAEEWKDVLAYFCGEEDSDSEASDRYGR